MRSALFACAVLSAPAVLACCPTFPISYTVPGVVAGTSDGTGYSVRVNVRYELELLGRHFFPEWAGRELHRIPCTSGEAHRADFREAAAAAGLGPDETEERLAEFIAFVEEAEERIEAGENIVLPPGRKDFEREFYLHALGRAQRLPDAPLSEPPAWLELLALPPERRRFRTVWARHGLVLAAPDLPTADQRLRELRADLDAGFRDTCGLEEAVVAQLLRRGDGTVNRLHWLPLAAAVRGSDRIEKALVDAADWLRVGDRWRTLRSEVRDIVASDPLAVETLVSLCGEQILPEDLRDAAPILCADRRAWAALEAGDLDRGRRLLSLAPTNSLVRLFWEARLARIDGDLGRSAELLRRWLAEAVARGGAPRGVFEIPVWENGWLFDGDGEYVYRTRSIERVVEGELGTVLLTEGDFEEALLAFLRARSWIDAAFVAERCMTVDALAAFVRALPLETASWTRFPWASDTASGNLRWLTARRMLREGRLAEAGEFFPASRIADWTAYTNLVAAARPGAPLPASGEKDDARALASLNLSRLLFARGMELLGTELEPDVHSCSGSFDYSGIGKRTLADLPGAKPLPAPLPPLPTTRFHYRPLATEAARRAAALAADPDIRIAAFLMQAQVFRFSYPYKPSPKEVEPAYRGLCRVSGRPIARIAREARWFPWAEAEPFYAPLERVRHDPSVPYSPLSLEDLRSLFAP